MSILKKGFISYITYYSKMNWKTCLFVFYVFARSDVTSRQVIEVAHRTHSFMDDGLVDCLGICRCNSGMGLVNCSGLELDRVPDNLPSHTITLDLSGNKITQIDHNELEGLRDLENLHLNDNLISKIHDSSFRESHSLKFLDLSKNKLNAWSPNITKPVEDSLEVLDLSSNRLGKVTRDMFNSALLKLRILNLDNNGLMSIEDFSFSQLSGLEILSLNVNVLKSFNKEGLTFTGLGNLTQLSLDSNFFNIVPEQGSFEAIQKSLRILSFSGHQRINELPRLDLPNLQEFTMAYCGIEFADNYTFIGTPRLRTLSLRGNSIRFLASQFLLGLNQLQTLQLQQNRFVAFPYRALSLVSNSLEVLYLDNNAIYRIVRNPFDANLLSNLQHLSLHNTFVFEIEGDSFFRHLQSLRMLNISSSRLEQIPKQALAHLATLEELDISNSLITELNSSSFPEMQSLRHLRIDQSQQLNLIESSAFADMGSNLSQLSISQGSLQELSQEAFFGLNTLSHLDLSGNDLRYGNPLWIEGKKLTKLKLGGNSWSCDCNTREFQEWLSSSNYRNIQDKDEVTCQYPRSLRGHPIASLDTGLLSCKPTGCPEMCLCGHITSEQKIVSDNRQNLETSFTHADCSGEGLLKPPPDLSLTTLGLRLDLNKFTGLNSSTFVDLPALERLWLGNNEIALIQETSFSSNPDLAELDLNSNQVEELQPQTFFNLTRLQVLRLDHNWISDIPPNLFRGQRSLSMLDISSNFLENLRDDSFTGLENLTDLVLANNALKNLTPFVFQSLKNLRRLYLSNNRISHVETGLISEMEKLETLHLSGNQITELDAWFLSSSSLSYLDLESSNVEAIRGNAFAALPELRTLRLRENRIREISETAFMFDNSTDYQSQIQSLDLSSNQLNFFPLEALKSTINLKSLFLNSNPITDLDDDSVIETPYLPHLQSLQLAHIDVTNVTNSSVFRLIPSLRTLIMNNAKLTRVPCAIFELLPQLETLNLDSNPIRILAGPDFSPHFNLSSFSLNFNEHLTKVSTNAFSNLSSLRSIHISRGSIDYIDKSAFEGLHHLRSLDLSGNRLTTPQKEWFMSSPSLGQLASYDNPWVCNCLALPYKQWLAQGAGGLNPTTMSVVCDEPMQLKGTRIENAEILCGATEDFTTIEPTTVMENTSTSEDANDTSTMQTSIGTTSLDGAAQTTPVAIETTSGAKPFQSNYYLLLLLVSFFFSQLRQEF